MRIDIARGVGLACFLCAFAACGTQAGAGDKVPTYAHDVAPILRARCQGCHRPGQVGPFSLMTFEQARKRADDLVAVVQNHQMPPWKPEPGFGPRLQQDRSLCAAEIRTITRWAEAGAPAGDDHDLAPAPVFRDDWTLGKPDLVLEMSEPFTIPPTGPDLYRCFVIPTNLPNDVHVSAIEYRPGNPRVVHHLMAFVETEGAGRARDQAEPGPGYSSYSGAGVEIVGDLGGWAPGNEPAHLPEGVGRSLPRRADVIVLVHYHPDGKPETDRTKIGLHFARKPVRQTLQWKGVMNQEIQLTPGSRDTAIKADWLLPVDVDVLAVSPHMHHLGRDMKITASRPDGRTVDLIHIADWDPDWQGTYTFEKPVHLPKGSTIHVVGRFDNSDRPGNPNRPPKLITFGHEATDEMCVGYIGVVKTGQDLTRPGEKDDLFAIFSDQYRRGLKRDYLSKRRR